jgi:phosphoglycerate dehydrogenase-like enzyme
MKIAILDDYLRRALSAADWSRLERTCEITVFDRPLGVPEEAAAALREFDIVCLLRERMPMSRELIGRLPNLKMIAVTGLYCRVLDVAAAAERGIAVSFTELRGPYRTATSELAWGLILAVARSIPQESSRMRDGGWQSTVGMTLSSRTLGLLGLGRQGRRMVPIAKAFGMEVIAWSQNLQADYAARFGVTRVDRDELFLTSYVLSILVVLCQRTRGLVGERELALMKPSAILVNTARGPIVDEACLVDALANRRIAGAGLDVYAQEPLPDRHPLRKLPNAVLMPHQGHHVEEFYQVAYADVVENIEAFLEGKAIRVLTAERNQSSLMD